METIEGVIEKIEQKTGSNTKGPWTSYIIRVRNHPKAISTFDITVGRGLEAGKAYSFQVEQKGDFLNLVKGTTPEEVAFPLPGPEVHPPSNAYQDTKDLSIRRQVALKAAVELVGYIIEHSNKKYIGPERVLSIAEGFDAWLNRAEAAHPFDPAQAEAEIGDLWEGPSPKPAPPVSEGTEAPPETPNPSEPQQGAAEGKIEGPDWYMGKIEKLLMERFEGQPDPEGCVKTWCENIFKVKTIAQIPESKLGSALELAQPLKK